MIQVLRHGNQVILNIGEVETLRRDRRAIQYANQLDYDDATYDIRGGSHPPVLVTPLRETLDDVRLVTHKPQETHDLLATRPYPPKHVALLRLLQYQYELVNTVDLVLNSLYKGAESVRDVVDERVGYPIRRYANVVFQLFNPSSDVLRVGRRSEMELTRALMKT